VLQNISESITALVTELGTWSSFLS